MPIAQDHSIQEKLAELVATHMAAANLLGRAQIAQAVHAKTGKRIPIASTSRMRHWHFGEDATDATIGFSLELPATGAADYLRKLTPVTKETYDGLTAQYRRDAFAVSGATDIRLIAKVRDELANVIQKGGTKQEFDAAVKKLTTAAGVEDINAFALDTIFTTNLQKAYSLGRFEQMTDPDVADALPYWQYLTVGDDRVRPEHAVLDTFTARVEDPVWRKIYPPNGFNCRCIVIPLLADEAPDGSDEPGYTRLPLLAEAKVPQAGFTKVF